MATADPQDLKPSEFGGRRGLIQREKGDLSASEKALLMRHTGQDPEAPIDQTARGTGRAFREGITEVGR